MVNYHDNYGINHDWQIKQWNVKDLLVKLWEQIHTKVIQHSLILLAFQLTPVKSEKNITEGQLFP